MRRSLLVLLVACTLVVAMVPRHRRAEDKDGEPQKVQYCAPQTPCGWSIYNKQLRNLIEQNITNSYCICTDTQTCSFVEDDEDAGTLVYKCTDNS